MKKTALCLIALLLAFVCVLSACNKLIRLEEKVTAFVLTKNALDKTKALNSLDLKTTLDLHAKATGFTMDIPIVYEMKIKDPNGDSPVGTVRMHMEAMMQKIDQDFWFDKDYVYTEQFGQKLRFPKDSEESGLDLNLDVDEMLKELPEKVLEEVEIRRNEDGTRTVAVDITEELFNELYKDFSSGTADLVLNDLLDDSGIDVHMSDFHVEITVAESGYLASYLIHFKAEMEFTGEEALLNGKVEYAVDAKTELQDPGKEVEVTLPEDLEEYIDFEKYLTENPYGEDWEYNEETGMYDYVGEDGEWTYDPETKDWYQESDGERFYFNEPHGGWFPDLEDWEYDGETDSYTYIGEDEAWQYDEEKAEWYWESEEEGRIWFSEAFGFLFPDEEDAA